MNPTPINAVFTPRGDSVVLHSDERNTADLTHRDIGKGIHIQTRAQCSRIHVSYLAELRQISHVSGCVTVQLLALDGDGDLHEVELDPAAIVRLMDVAQAREAAAL